jgi:hypothetical protein
MQLAVHTIFAASRKEPLAAVLERVHAAIIAAGLGEPEVQFVLSDAPVEGGVRTVDRVLKRLPSLERFLQNLALYPGGPEMRVISNLAGSGTTGEAVDFGTLLEIAAGVPRSFPFHNIALHFSVPAFAAAATPPSTPGGLMPGIDVRDSWWVNGRQRSLTALVIVEADPAARKLPAPSEPVAAVFAACGKVKKSVQVPLAVAPAQPPSRAAVPSDAIATVVREYRARMTEIVDRAALPHDLPPTEEAIATTSLGLNAGPKKPALLRAFAPLGYDCRGEAGTFTLRRRTPGNLWAELYLDVGSWSSHVTAIFHVHGLFAGTGFKATLILPVTRRAAGGQYPIGGPDRWQEIVDNLSALTAELDRSFVPAIEAVCGPAPDWYRPEG